MTTLIRAEAIKWITKNFGTFKYPGNGSELWRQEKRSTNPKDHWNQVCTCDTAYYQRLWKDGKKDTSCKDVTAKYALDLGMDSRAGALFPAGGLKQLHKEYAWVDSASGDLPEFGDICVWHGHHHVGISLGADIGMPTDQQWTTLDVLAWYTIEGGQEMVPRYDKEHDKFDPPNPAAIIRCKKYPDPEYPVINSRGERGNPSYTPALLEGWVSIERYFYFAQYGPDPDQWPQVPEPTPALPADGGASSSLWRREDGQTVHPGAPDGAGGPGYFASAGSLSGDLFKQGLPHPLAPDGRYLDPLKIGKAGRSA